MSVDQLTTDHTAFVNYRGVEDDPAALAIIDEYIQKGWLYECDSHDALTEFVGGEPVLNKFACVVKQKPDGSLKHRIIMDSKQSMVTAASRKVYKAVLPRATDLINDVAALIDSCDAKEEVEAFVLDADDAFWQIPLCTVRTAVLLCGPTPTRWQDFILGVQPHSPRLSRSPACLGGHVRPHLQVRSEHAPN